MTFVVYNKPTSLIISIWQAPPYTINVCAYTVHAVVLSRCPVFFFISQLIRRPFQGRAQDLLVGEEVFIWFH